MPPSFTEFFRLIGRFSKRIFSRSEDADILRFTDTLQQVPLLEELSAHTLRHLAHAVHYRTFRAEETIYYQGDPGLGLYIIEHGTVELFVGGETERERVCLVNDHECFGVYSLLGEFPRLETARAKSDSQLLGFFRPDFRTLVKRHPQSGLHLLSRLAQELAARQNELIEHHVSTDRSRAALLRSMYEISPESVAHRPSSLID
jgi:CRP-like cAMP-binding protein